MDCSQQRLLVLLPLWWAFFLLDPGASLFQVGDSAEHSDKRVDVVKPHTFVLLSHVILFSASLFLVFHKISKELLRFAFGFDSAVIVISCGVCEVALLHEIIKNYQVANIPLPTVDIVFYASRSILTMIAHFSVSVMDAWTFNTWGKMGVLIPFVVCLSTFYVKQRFVMQWSNRQTCLFGECTTWQGVYLNALKNEIIFGVKLLLPYLQGRSYAVLRFLAIDPERELYKRQRETIKKSRRSQESTRWQRSTWQQSRISGGSDAVSCPSVSISYARGSEKSMEEVIEEYKEAAMLEKDSWQLDEMGQDDEFLHQTSRPDVLCQAELTGNYFDSCNADLQVHGIRSLGKNQVSEHETRGPFTKGGVLKDDRHTLSAL